jgi:hypothetical protein
MLRRSSARRLQMETLENRRTLSADGFLGGVFVGAADPGPSLPSAQDDVYVDGRVITGWGVGAYAKAFDGTAGAEALSSGEDPVPAGTLIPVKVKHNV